MFTFLSANIWRAAAMAIAALFLAVLVCLGMSHAHVKRLQVDLTEEKQHSAAIEALNKSLNSDLQAQNEAVQSAKTLADSAQKSLKDALAAQKIEQVRTVTLWRTLKAKPMPATCSDAMDTVNQVLKEAK